MRKRNDARDPKAIAGQLARAGCPAERAVIAGAGAGEERRMQGDRMERRSGSIRNAAVSAALFAVAFMTMQPAQAGMRAVDGQAYWEGDPGPVAPGPYWTGGQHEYDRHHYNSYYGDDPQGFTMTVYAQHAGKARCVWRRRVINTGWEFRHPYLRVCRSKR